MALRDDVPALIEIWKGQEGLIAHNAEAFEIFEGDLLASLRTELKKQFTDPKTFKLSPAFDDVMGRIPPINLLKRVIDKLSKIYAEPPKRKLPDGAPKSDKDLLDFYIKAYEVDTAMGGANGANGLFNLFKNTWVEPFLDQGKPRLRVVPSDRFFVYSNDRVNPTRPTHFVKIMGKMKVGQTNEERVIFYAYTSDEFLVFDDKQEVRTEIMAQLGNPAGNNPIKRLPGVYINRSKYKLIPTRDTDTIAMVKLLPIMLGDLNYALKYQCFSTIYTINVDQTKLEMNPNVVWDLKSNGTSDGEPKVGMIKPEVDSDKLLGSVKSQLALWMQSRNIKPGAMDGLNAENLASGVAKVIDEMDTSEDRKEQVPYFIVAEEDLWALTQILHNEIWSKDPMFDSEHKVAFSTEFKVQTMFAEQRPVVDSSKAIEDEKKKIEMRIQTREGALRALEPNLTDEQVQERLKAADKEATENQKRAMENAAAMAGADPKAVKGPVPPRPDEKGAAAA